MIHLYLMRHGHAVGHAPTDDQRPLSETGRAEVAAMVAKLLPVPPMEIQASPYLRARQTAELVQQGLRAGGVEVPVVIRDGMTPEADPGQWLAQFPGNGGGPLLLVTHNPFVSSLLSLLTQGHYQADIGMHTGSIASLTATVMGPGTAQLQWYEAP